LQKRNENTNDDLQKPLSHDVNSSVNNGGKQTELDAGGPKANVTHDYTSLMGEVGTQNIAGGPNASTIPKTVAMKGIEDLTAVSLDEKSPGAASKAPLDPLNAQIENCSELNLEEKSPGSTE
jgi:hypothetical protein